MEALLSNDEIDQVESADSAEPEVPVDSIKETAAIGYELFILMQREIDALSNKISGFGRAYERSDYRGEAYLACLEAAAKFCRHHIRKTDDPDAPVDYRSISKMQKKVYTYLHIKKKLYHMADVHEVDFDIYDKDERYIKRLSNTDYRKERKILKQQNCIVKSVRTTHSFSELTSVRDGKVTEYDPVAAEIEYDLDMGL